MKDKVNPIAAISAVAIVLVIVAFFLIRGGSNSSVGDKPPGMPPAVAAEFQQRMGTNTPTGAHTGPTAAPASPMPGGYVAPPPAGH